MKRVLIISPHFPPVNAPDHQRVRMALPHLEKSGWKAEVLAIAPSTISAPQDLSLLELLPAGFSPHLTDALPLSLSGIPGLGTLTGRAYHALKRAGDTLIQKQHFDLTFFSTTQFGTFNLGPYWKQKWKIPFALDLQDPWINFFYRDQGIKPPGGHIKFNVQQWIARNQARTTIPESSGLCAVSKEYITYFKKQNWVSPSCNQLTLPFAYSQQDWVAARNRTTKPPWRDLNDSNCMHWVYAGRGGQDLSPCLRALFRSLQLISKHPSAENKTLHLWFIGTHYGITKHNEKSIEKLAAAYNYPHVHEITERLPYLDVLNIMQQSDGLIIPGSIDSRYQPSKLVPLLASGKPLLALAPSISPCAEMMQEAAPTNLITYELPFNEAELTKKLCHYWQEEAFQLPVVGENTIDFLSHHEAEVAAVRLCDFFNHCISHA